MIKTEAKQQSVSTQKSSSFLKADQFGRNFEMHLDGSFNEMRSYMGASLSLMYVFLLLIFLLIKLTTIYQKHDVDIMSTVQSRGLPNETIFGRKQGLNIAGVLTEYSDETEIQDFERFGTLKF